MYHLARLAYNLTPLYHSGKHYNAGGESLPMHYSSREEAELIVVGRGRYLSVCQGVGEFGLHAIRYKVFSNWDGNKVICDLVHHDYASLI